MRLFANEFYEIRKRLTQAEFAVEENGEELADFELLEKNLQAVESQIDLIRVKANG